MEYMELDVPYTVILGECGMLETSRIRAETIWHWPTYDEDFKNKEVSIIMASLPFSKMTIYQNELIKDTIITLNLIMLGKMNGDVRGLVTCNIHKVIPNVLVEHCNASVGKLCAKDDKPEYAIDAAVVASKLVSYREQLCKTSRTQLRRWLGSDAPALYEELQIPINCADSDFVLNDLNWYMCDQLKFEPNMFKMHYTSNVTGRYIVVKLEIDLLTKAHKDRQSFSSPDCSSKDEPLECIRLTSE